MHQFAMDCVQQSDRHHQTTTSKVTTETVQPEIIKPSTTETGTSPISLSPQRTYPSIGKPLTTESTSITESMKTEKLFSIKMDRTPLPAFHRPTEETNTAKEVQIPVHVEEKPESASTNKESEMKQVQIQVLVEKKPESDATVKELERKEIEIPVHIERNSELFPTISETKEITAVIEEQKSERKEFVIKEDLKMIEKQFIEQMPHELIKEQAIQSCDFQNEETGVESGSISRKSALDFFVSKLSETESDVSKDRVKEPEIIPLRTSVKENISQFEELHVKESDQHYPSKQTEAGPSPAVHEKIDTEEKTPKPFPPHADFLSRESPSLFLKGDNEQHSSIFQSEIHKELPLLDSQSHESSHFSQPVKFNTFPFQSSTKSQFHTEKSKFEKHITQQYVHHSTSSLDEFNLQPEPPPEMGYIPKTEVPSKLRLDMSSRVKKLEESHRVLSPVEIPSGAVRIFPAPIRSETPTAEKREPQAKCETQSKPFTEIQAVSMSEEVKEVEEDLIRKEIVEEVSVQKKVYLPGTEDWTCQHSASAVKPVPEKHAPSKPVWPPQPPEEVQSLDQYASDLLPVKPSTIIQPPVLKQSSTETVQVQMSTIKSEQSVTESVRSVSPRPSAQALSMEKLWASRRTPEPEVVGLPVEPVMDIKSPKPLIPDLPDKSVSPSITKSSVQETDIRCATSPRPSAEGVAMEKLWTPHKTAEPEPVIAKPVSTDQEQFEKAMSPKPSMEGLAMDKIWAHRHPDSALRNAWPPPQPVEEKPVIPWAVKGSVEKTWPPTEPVSSVNQESDTKSHKETQVQQEETKKVQERPPPLKAQQQAKEVEIPDSEIITRDYKKEDVETKSSILHVHSTPPSVPSNIQHYVAEARVVHSSAVKESEIQSVTTTTEHVEIKSELAEDSKTISSILPVPEVPSPPVVEEKVLRPSEAKKMWPPGSKDEFELKAPPIPKDFLPRKETLSKPKPVQEMVIETFLEPGPPPEIGFAPAPPVQRRQSLVETIEQDLKKDLEKEPSRHIVGAVRTIPSPLQKEKSVPPPLPPKEKSVPPPLPPKEKVLEVRPVTLHKKEAKKPVIIEKPFERFPDLEPFPFKPDEPVPKPVKCPPPPKPSKFIKGEFASSDYESDIESVHISSKWRPYESETEEVLGYRKVVPPALKQPRRPKSTDPDPLPPSKFDHPPQFVGPPRPTIDKVQASKKEIKELKTEITKVTSKVEMKTEKVKKYHHHHHNHASESKKKHSPPTLKPGSPPIFVQPGASLTQDDVKPVADQKKSEPVASPKIKPDSPKLKAKTTQSEFPESGYMADTDEPRHLRQTTHKYSHFKHEESSKTTVEHTTTVSDKVSEQSTQSEQQQEKTEKQLPAKPYPSPKFHHRHSDHKSEKKVVVSSTTTPSKPKKVRCVVDLCCSSPTYLLSHQLISTLNSIMCGFIFCVSMYVVQFQLMILT